MGNEHHCVSTVFLIIPNDIILYFNRTDLHCDLWPVNFSKGKGTSNVVNVRRLQVNPTTERPQQVKLEHRISFH